MDDRKPWPTEIRLAKDKRELALTYDSGAVYVLPAELLRVLSPSAEVQGHSPEQRKTVPGKAGVTITKVDPVGRYAVRLTFSDGHNTGLYSWEYLRRLGQDREALWSAYLAELAEKGLSRDR